VCGPHATQCQKHLSCDNARVFNSAARPKLAGTSKLETTVSEQRERFGKTYPSFIAELRKKRSTTCLPRLPEAIRRLFLHQRGGSPQRQLEIMRRNSVAISTLRTP